eukprot:768082-Hanusia_phi.AAC.9
MGFQEAYQGRERKRHECRALATPFLLFPPPPLPTPQPLLRLSLPLPSSQRATGALSALNPFPTHRNPFFDHPKILMSIP